MKILKKNCTGKVLTTILILFMLSWVTLLSSCVETVRTPGYSGSTILIEGQNHNRRHDRSDRRKERREQRQRGEHHD